MRGDLFSKMERLYFQPFCPWCGTGMQGGLLLNPLAKKITYIKRFVKCERGTTHRLFPTELPKNRIYLYKRAQQSPAPTRFKYNYVRQPRETKTACYANLAAARRSPSGEKVRKYT